MNPGEAREVADVFGRDLEELIGKWIGRLDELQQAGEDPAKLLPHLGNGLVDAGKRLKKMAKVV